MCLPKTPKIETPPPAPTFDEARVDNPADIRQDERKRQRNAVNSRTTLLSQGSDSGTGRKTLLGQ